MYGTTTNSIEKWKRTPVYLPHTIAATNFSVPRPTNGLFPHLCHSRNSRAAPICQHPVAYHRINAHLYALAKCEVQKVSTQALFMQLETTDYRLVSHSVQQNKRVNRNIYHPAAGTLCFPVPHAHSGNDQPFIVSTFKCSGFAATCCTTALCQPTCISIARATCPRLPAPTLPCIVIQAILSGLIESELKRFSKRTHCHAHTHSHTLYVYIHLCMPARSVHVCAQVHLALFS